MHEESALGSPISTSRCFLAGWRGRSGREPFLQEHGLLAAAFRSARVGELQKLCVVMSSYKGRLVDALGQSADEGRDQRRNA